MSWEIGWWKSERDKRRDYEYRLALQRKKMEAEQRRETLTRVALSVLVAFVVMSLVMVIAG